jgi:excisionase family DNA binding protein
VEGSRLSSRRRFDMATEPVEVKVKRTPSGRHEIAVVAEAAAAYGVKVPAEQLEQSLTRDQVAEVMGLSVEEVKQWIYQRRLPAVKLANGNWRVRKSDLERFLQARLKETKYRLMVVGADAETLKTVNRALDPRRYEILVTNLVADALLKIRDLRPSLIVVDVAWQHGWKLIEDIHAARGARPIPVLVVDGAMGEADVHRAAHLDVKGCLNKPLSGPALTQEITSIQNRYA